MKIVRAESWNNIYRKWKYENVENEMKQQESRERLAQWNDENI